MKNIIKREQVRLGEPGPAARRAPAATPEAPRSGARLVDLDAGTQAIEFTCSCGQTSLIEIQCEQKQ
jgi:hypothetical protein